jgi:hypothetical protein
VIAQRNEGGGTAHPRAIRSFVTRAGRTTTAQARALTELGPRYLLPYDPATTDLVAACSEAVNKFGVPEQVAKTCPIKAQSADIARAMASICNAERGRFDGLSGHGGFVHSLSRSVATEFCPTPASDAISSAMSGGGIDASKCKKYQ